MGPNLAERRVVFCVPCNKTFTYDWRVKVPPHCEKCGTPPKFVGVYFVRTNEGAKLPAQELGSDGKWRKDLNE